MNRRELQALIDSKAGGAVVIPNGDHLIDHHPTGVGAPAHPAPSCPGAGVV